MHTGYDDDLSGPLLTRHLPGHWPTFIPTLTEPKARLDLSLHR